jgi:hypothetical protein
MEAGVATMKRGQVAVETEGGSRLNIDRREGAVTTRLTENQGTTRKIVLKIEGSTMYFLSISDEGTPQEDRTVVQEIWSADALREVLREPGFSLSGNDLLYNMTSNGVDELTEGGQIQYREVVSTRINLSNPYCDKSTELRVENLRVSYNGAVSTQPTYTQTSQTACTVELTPAQLKALDLSSIRYCENGQDENDNCEQDQNMEFLTDDL